MPTRHVNTTSHLYALPPLEAYFIRQVDDVADWLGVLCSRAPGWIQRVWPRLELWNKMEVTGDGVRSPQLLRCFTSGTTRCNTRNRLIVSPVKCSYCRQGFYPNDWTYLVNFGPLEWLRSIEFSGDRCRCSDSTLRHLPLSDRLIVAERGARGGHCACAGLQRYFVTTWGRCWPTYFCQCVSAASSRFTFYYFENEFLFQGLI